MFSVTVYSLYMYFYDIQICFYVYNYYHNMEYRYVFFTAIITTTSYYWYHYYYYTIININEAVNCFRRQWMSWQGSTVQIQTYSTQQGWWSQIS